MKKTIIAFVLGGVITAGAFGISYGLPITSAAEKTTPDKPAAEMTQQCTEMMKSPDMQNMMKSMMPDSKTLDPKVAEEMKLQCTEMMKNPDMQKEKMPAGEMDHAAHH